MKLRCLSIVLSTLAVGLAGYAFYISPDPTVSNRINKGDGNEILLAGTRLIENPDTNANNLPMFLVKRARAARKLRGFEVALNDINRALELQPTKRLFWVERAFIYNAHDDWIAADDDFERALEINLNSKRAMSGIIRSNENLEQYDSALEWLDMAAEQWPDDAHLPTVGGAIHYLFFRDYLAALADSDAVERIDPDYIANRLMLGATHLALGHLEIGKTYVDQQAAQLVQSMETEGSLFKRAKG